MPNLGEVVSGRKLGRTSGTRHQWVACPDCGKERWVAFRNGLLSHIHCTSCAAKHRRHRRKDGHGFNWKGGRVSEGRGYILVTISKESAFYCMANKSSYVLEHRLVVAERIGRPLLSSEIVHHINGVKTDNRSENLKLVASMKEHFNAVLEENKQLREQVRNLEERAKKLESEEGG